MTIAIHHDKNSFSTRWIEYCEQEGINYKIVNCYDSDIVATLQNCEALLWHHNHANPKDVLFARQLLSSLEMCGKVVFPNHVTAWHFDDKVGQKYLLEAINAPNVPSHVYYSKHEALKAVKAATFPIVFKLRGGAGSRNVMLLKTEAHATKMINKAFGSGFRQYDAISGIKEQIRKYRLKKAGPVDILKAAAHIVYPIQLEKSKGREAGYFYYQDFLPNNGHDIRVIVIGNKAFGLKRMVRKNDFRASGSGDIIYDPGQIDTSCLTLAFNVYNKMKGAQCLAFDFIFDEHNNPLIVEISYGFAHKAYDTCPGYWNSNLEWFDGPFNPLGFIINDVVKAIGTND